VQVAFAYGGFHALCDETTPSAVILDRADCPCKKALFINTLTASSEILRCSLQPPRYALQHISVRMLYQPLFPSGGGGSRICCYPSPLGGDEIYRVGRATSTLSPKIPLAPFGSIAGGRWCAV